MKDVYVDKFLTLIQETSCKTGTTVHPHLEVYVSYLLAAHITRTDFFTEPVALRYMSLNSRLGAKDLGDNCLIIAGIFSGFRNLNDEYYVAIGSDAYRVAASYTGSEIFKNLAVDFGQIKSLLNNIHPPRYI